MQNTTHYNLTKAEGTDTVNLLTQCYPNFDTIDAAMFANKQGSIGTATEVTTGTVHAITRNNADSDVFRFTATSAWTAGDTMTLDGVGVTVHLADGTTPATGAYVIGAEVLGVVNGSLVTLFLSSAIQTYVSSFNNRSGAVSPTASDYDASMIDYDNTISGLNATDVQGAIDEVVANMPSGGSVDYSTTEHAIGTWVDGSILYEKTIFCGALPNNTATTTPHNISNLGRIIDFRANAVNTNTMSAKILPFYTSSYACVAFCEIGATNISLYASGDRSAYNSTYVTIRYTKTV